MMALLRSISLLIMFMFFSFTGLTQVRIASEESLLPKEYISGVVFEVYALKGGVRLPTLSLTDTATYRLGDEILETYPEANGVVILHNGGGSGLLENPRFFYWNGFQWIALEGNSQNMMGETIKATLVEADTIRGWIEDTKIFSTTRSLVNVSVEEVIDTLSEGLYELIAMETGSTDFRHSEVYCSGNTVTNLDLDFNNYQFSITYSPTLQKYLVKLLFTGGGEVMYRRKILSKF